MSPILALFPRLGSCRTVRPHRTTDPGETVGSNGVGSYGFGSYGVGSARVRVTPGRSALVLLILLLLIQGVSSFGLSVPGFPTLGISTARAQDGGWWPGFGAQGADLWVFALEDYDDRLAVGGWFSQAGGAPLARVGLWDGAGWAPLGSGIQGSGVYALAVYRGDLIAAGQFLQAGGVPASNIARWDGTAWHSLGTGLNDLVWALGVYDDELYAGGFFSVAGGQQIRFLARWNGTEWNPVGGGLVGQPGFATGALAFREHGGELIVGGGFATAGGVESTNIARWDGETWHPMAGGTNGLVYALGSYEGELIVGGGFTQAGGTATRRIARWDGAAFHALGTGMSGGDHAVASLGEFAGQLLAGGVFTLAGDQPASRIAAWNGSIWSPLDEGTNGAVRAIREYGGSLYVGGDFTSAGGSPSLYIARWDPSTTGIGDVAGDGWDGGTGGDDDSTRICVPGDSGSCVPGGLCDGVPERPTESLRFAAPYPNPSNGRVGFAYGLPTEADVRLTVFDLSGRRIATVTHRHAPAGWSAAQWSGRGEDGREMPPGVYFARLEALGEARTMKLLRIP